VVAAVVVYGLASAPAAAIVLSLWRSPRQPPFLPLYAATLLVVSTVAVAVLRLPSLTRDSSSALALASVVGLAGGEAAVRADGAVRRALRRRARLHAAAEDRALLGRRPLVPPPGAAAPTAALPGAGLQALALLLAVAVLEEILYRGVLVDLSLQLPVAAAAVSIPVTVVAFGAAHVYWGWVEMVAKLPLGLAALLASLPFRALVGAIAAHVLFNARSWLAVRTAGGPAG
jgi:hypothetical protein